jgi:hypothetical protein
MCRYRWSRRSFARDLPGLHLAEIYSAVTYHLHHRPEVEEYLRGRASQVEDARREAEARFDPTGIRDRLRARMRA